MTDPDGARAVPDPPATAERVAAAVVAVPGVAGLSAGPYGALATWLPGRRLVGVRIGEEGGPVEVGVVARLTAPIPDVVAAVRRAVSAVVDDRAVDVVVADVETGIETGRDTGADAIAPAQQPRRVR